MAVKTRRLDRVCGVHFFNPAPVMKLVEIVRPLPPSDETIDAVTALRRDVREGRGEVVEDRAGFVVNALLFPYLNNAVRMWEQGTASRDDIDTAMKGGCNFPMGPFALLDLVGLDTSLAILDALYDEFRDPNYAAVPTLRRMVVLPANSVASTSRGFYEYRKSPRRGPMTARRSSRRRLPGSSRHRSRPTRTVSSASAPTSTRHLAGAYRSGLFPMPVGVAGPGVVVARPTGYHPLRRVPVSLSLRRARAAMGSVSTRGSPP